MGGEKNMRVLTKTEQEVLDALTQEFLTPYQVALRRKITKQAVYKFIRKIRAKGYLHYGVTTPNNSFQSTQPTKNISIQRIRLHSQEWNIYILRKTQQYEAIRKRINHIIVDSNTIRLYKESVEIYSKKSFLGINPQEATSLSMDYWNRFFVRLETELCVDLIKPRYQNIRLVASHYAETNNEFAKEQAKDNVKVRVFTKDDGKLWFVIDNSFNLHEAETLHPETSKPDMEKVKDFFNDIRDKPRATMSELLIVVKALAEQSQENLLIIKALTEQNKETSAGLLVLIKLLGGNTTQGTGQEQEQPLKRGMDYIG